jgi:hypothetical protein
MGIFPRYRFELLPDQSDSFVTMVRLTERNGWGNGTVGGVLSLLRSLPYQAIQPEFFNLNRSSMNFRSMLRWDTQKRRLFASFSMPLAQQPKWRFAADLDARDEIWDLSETFQGTVSPQSDVNLQKVSAVAAIRSVVSGRWSWNSAVSFSYRHFRGLTAIAPQTAPLFANGFLLRYHAGTEHALLHDPERRLTIDSSLSGHFGKGSGDLLGAFSGAGGSLDLRWFPLAVSDEYEIRSQFRAGMIAGRVPLDEFFMLGIERDTHLWLRGHVGTRNGKKGNAPLGRRFVLWNWEGDKIVHQNVFLTVKLGPFLDVGKITDPSGEVGSEGWLWDPGVQCKVSAFGGFTFVLSYGKDLRSGRGALYTTVSR